MSRCERNIIPGHTEELSLQAQDFTCNPTIATQKMKTKYEFRPLIKASKRLYQHLGSKSRQESWFNNREQASMLISRKDSHTWIEKSNGQRNATPRRLSTKVWSLNLKYTLKINQVWKVGSDVGSLSVGNLIETTESRNKSYTFTNFHAIANFPKTTLKLISESPLNTRSSQSIDSRFKYASRPPALHLTIIFPRISSPLTLNSPTTSRSWHRWFLILQHESLSELNDLTKQEKEVPCSLFNIQGSALANERTTTTCRNLKCNL